MAELFGLITAAVGTVDLILNRLDSLATRCRNTSGNKDRFVALSLNFRDVLILLANVRSLQEKAGSLPSSEALRNFSQTVGRIRQLLAEADTTTAKLDRSLATNDGSTSSRRSFFSSRRRVASFINANRTAEALDRLEAVLGQARDPLERLTGFLDMSVQLAAAAKGIQRGDAFKACFSLPVLPPRVVLNWDCDSCGRPVTMEGGLKKSLMESVQAEDGSVTVADGSSIAGASGHGGVGKTTALIGVGRHADVQKHFEDGVYFIAVGKDASEQSLVASLARLVRLCGGKESALEISAARSMADAVSETAGFFEGKQALFLLDDLWPIGNDDVGYLGELRQLVSTCSASRIVITTRSNKIANQGGQRIAFASREPESAAAKEMLYISAGISSTEIGEYSMEISEELQCILQSCGGLPLTLSVAGCAIREIRGIQGKQSCIPSAIKLYAKKLLEGTAKLTSESVLSHSNFETSVRVSLGIADERYKGSVVNVNQNNKLVSSLYKRLAILRKQMWVSNKMLRQLWGFDTDREVEEILMLLSNFNLVSQQWGEDGQLETGLHDLMLEYCVADAGEQLATYHSMILSAYCRSTRKSETVSGTKPPSVSKDIGIAPDASEIRPLWRDDVLSDSYIIANVSRHLAGSGELRELVGLLADARWAMMRLAKGGLPAWNTDFTELFSMLKSEADGFVGVQKVSVELRLVRDAVRESWGFVRSNLQEFLFQVHSRLRDLGEGSWPMQHFLVSARANIDGPWLCSLSRCWAMPGSCLLQIPLGYISCVAVAKTKAVVGLGNRVCAIDLKTGVTLWTTEEHGADVLSVAISEDEVVVASGSRDSTIKTWDGETGQALYGTLSGHQDGVMSLVASADGHRIVSGSTDGTMGVWDINSGGLTGLFVVDPNDEHPSPVASVGLSAGGEIAAGAVQDMVRVWDCDKECYVGEPLGGHTGWVTSVAVSSKGDRVASACTDKLVRVWDVANRELAVEPLRGHTAPVLCIGMSPDDRLIVSGSIDKTVRIWNADTGNPVGNVLHGHTGSVRGVAVSADGKCIVSTSSDLTVRVWDSRGTQLRNDVSIDHEDAVWCLAVSADGRRIVTGSNDESIRIWDAESTEALSDCLYGHTDAIWCVAISANGRRVVSGSRDGTVRVWDGETGQPMGEPLRGHTDWIWGLALSDDEQHIVSGAGDETVRLWNTDTGQSVGDPWKFSGRLRDLCVIENVVIARTEDAVFKWILKKEVGLVPLLEDEGQVTDMTTEQGNDSGSSTSDGIKVRCSGTSVLLRQGTTEQVLATLPSATGETWHFDAARMQLVTGLRDGSVLWHRLVRRENQPQIL